MYLELLVVQNSTVPSVASVTVLVFHTVTD